MSRKYKSGDKHFTYNEMKKFDRMIRSQRMKYIEGVWTRLLARVNKEIEERNELRGIKPSRVNLMKRLMGVRR